MMSPLVALVHASEALQTEMEYMEGVWAAEELQAEFGPRGSGPGSGSIQGSSYGPLQSTADWVPRPKRWVKKGSDPVVKEEVVSDDEVDPRDI